MVVRDIRTKRPYLHQRCSHRLTTVEGFYWLTSHNRDLLWLLAMGPHIIRISTVEKTDTVLPRGFINTFIPAPYYIAIQVISGRIVMGAVLQAGSDSDDTLRLQYD